MKTTLHAIVASVLSLAALHCTASTTGTGGGSSGSSGDTTTAASALEFCNSVCTRVNTCDQSEDVDTCSNQCSNAFASIYPKLRGDFVANVQKCWDRKDCKHVLGSTTVFSSCVAEAVESIAPSAAGTSLCDDIDTSLKKCSSSLDRANCLSIVKRYNDTAIGSAGKCVDKGCSDVMPCVRSALDLSVIDDAPSPSPTPSPSGSSSGPTPPPSAPPGPAPSP